MTTAILELTQEQIDANRRKVIRALRRSKNQCRVDTFRGTKVCALGAAMRALLLIKNEKQYEAYEAHGNDAWQDVADLLALGEDGISWLWRMNDNERLTLPEIGVECERRWFGAS